MALNEVRPYKTLLSALFPQVFSWMISLQGSSPVNEKLCFCFVEKWNIEVGFNSQVDKNYYGKNVQKGNLLADNLIFPWKNYAKSNLFVHFGLPFPSFLSE